MPLHLFIVHFPVALIMAGAVIDLSGVALSNGEVRSWGGLLLMAGGIAAFLAFATGEGALLAAIPSGELDPLRLESHQQWGSVGAWALLLAALVRAMWRRRLDGPYGWANTALSIASAALVIAITLSGTLVRHSG